MSCCISTEQPNTVQYIRPRCDHSPDTLQPGSGDAFFCLISNGVILHLGSHLPRLPSPRLFHFSNPDGTNRCECNAALLSVDGGHPERNASAFYVFGYLRHRFANVPTVRRWWSTIPGLWAQHQNFDGKAAATHGCHMHVMP
jgi:hypothetical protein